ncbi:MAG: zinc-ribbon domain containing protein [Armatimonadetes bacterium]|nr:zinc-ribbon domain containing protein [Armatimonadota bacterium]
MYQDRNLTCRDCGAEFTFTASEQEFYAEKGFLNDPGRCPQCRAARKNQNRRDNRSGYSRERVMYPAICSRCGKETEVPFRPNGSKPVYCKECYRLATNY